MWSQYRLVLLLFRQRSGLDNKDADVKCAYLHFHVSSQLEVKVAKLVQHFLGGGGQVDL